jgi:hypothetical protein
MISTFLAAALALAGGAPSAPPSGPAPYDPGASASAAADQAAAKKPLPPAAVLEDVVGTVQSVDHAHHRVTVDTSAGPEELQLDRNTLVYAAHGLGTLLDVEPGVRVRAGRNADSLAYWVSVQTPQAGLGTGPTMGQGSDVTRGAGPPPERGAPAAPAGGSPPAPGAVAPGGAR